MTNGSAVKVCVLLNGETLNRYAANALRRMVEETSAEVSLLVINSGTESVKNESEGGVSLRLKKGLKLWKKHGVWSIIIIKRTVFPPVYAENVHIDNIECFSDACRLRTEPISAEGLGNTLPNSIVEKISSKSDVVIRFGFGIIKGDVLTRPKFGVLSFHHGDIRKYRGRAGGFWAYINEDDTAGVTLQQLNESLDGGKIAVYKSVDITDADTFKEVRNRIHDVSKEMLANAIRKIENNEFKPEKPNELGDLYTERELRHIIKFFSKNTFGLIKSKFGTLKRH